MTGFDPVTGPNLDRFLETYRQERRRLHVERPELYSAEPLIIRGNAGIVTLPPARSEEGIAKFCDAIRAGSFGLDGEALRATCRRLRIRRTYKAIRAWVACVVPDHAIHYAEPGWGAECGRANVPHTPDRRRVNCPACVALLLEAADVAKLDRAPPA